MKIQVFPRMKTLWQAICAVKIVLLLRVIPKSNIVIKPQGVLVAYSAPRN